MIQMRSFLYLVSTENDDSRLPPACKAICTEFSILPDNVVVEFIDNLRPLSDQRLLDALLTDKMNKGDLLVVTNLSSLGRNVEDIEKALFFCFRKEINIYCYHSYTRIEPTAESCISFLIAAQTKVDIQNIKSTRSKHRTIKKPLGRREGSKYKTDILKLKAAGYKQSQVARILSISTSTVKRHWSTKIIG
ncbi:recombinase family protein [Salmonella enterica subsp. enterica serovar Java]|nr:recombinase family protein [Salmonella enterica subsp. enterica serovar Java]ECB7403980.1 recombinase family protein [Salmonella enterica subsp. enterica serovar Java]